LISDRESLAAIFQAVDGKTGTVQITPHIGDAKASEGFVVVTNAELPAATASNARFFVAYIAKADQHQSIWLVSASEPH
jgi:hypothetical protein